MRKAGVRQGTALLGVTVLAVALATGCGEGASANRVRSSGGGQTEAASRNHDPSDGKRLRSRRVRHDEQVVFDPPGSVRARHSEAEALKTMRQQGSHGYLLDEKRSRESFFALYTDKGTGQAGPDGELVPTYQSVPVWVVIVRDVPINPPSGGPANSQSDGAARTQGPPTDVTFIVDDATNKMLMTLLGP